MLILHGENTLASRQYLGQITDSFKGEIIRIEANQIDLPLLIQALEAKSLFGQEKKIIVENLFTGRKSNNKQEAIDYLKTNQDERLIIWEPKNIDGRKIISFKKAKIRKFEITKYLFRLLDSLKPTNTRQSLNLLNEVLKTDPPEMVFYMLVRQVRLLIIAKDLGYKGLSKMAPWQRKKLTDQAENFTMERLIRLQRNLLKIDYDQKTGKAIMPFKSVLELFITEF